MGLVLAAALVLALGADPASAQKPETATCPEPSALPALSGCRIQECTHREYDEAELQSGALDASGEFPRRSVEGQTSVVTYVCAGAADPETLARQAEKTLRRAGFAMVYAGGMYYNDLPGFTARKGNEWIQVVSESLDEGPSYTVTAVKATAPMTRSGPRPAKKAGAPARRH